MPKHDIPQHPEIQRKQKAWNRIEILLDQDEDKIKEKFSIQFPNESNESFAERKKYFAQTFINQAQDLVSAPVNSIFRQSLTEEYGEENSLTYEFAQNVTLGDEVTPYARYVKDFVGVGLRSYGNVFIVVDKPREVPISKEAERKEGLPYLSMIQPQNVLNWQIVNGEMIWFAYRSEYNPVWEDPVNVEQPETENLINVWTQTDFVVINEDGDLNRDMSYTHNWGFVPVVVQGAFRAMPGDLIGNAAMDQTSNMIVIYNNLLNQGVYELFKHGGSLLLMPNDAIGATNFDADADGNPHLKRQDNNGMLMFEGEVLPQYLVKELAVEMIKEWAMSYAQAAYENERDLKSVVKRGNGDAAKQVAESGISKIIDRDPLETNLISLAEDIEICTDKIFQIVTKLLEEEDNHKFEFDKDFDLKTLSVKFDEIQKAQNAGIERKSISLANEMWKNVIGNITRDVETQEAAKEEIDNSEPLEPDEEEINKLIDSQFSNNIKKKEKIVEK